jgi:hypothetical protein
LLEKVKRGVSAQEGLRAGKVLEDYEDEGVAVWKLAWSTPNTL